MKEVGEPEYKIVDDIEFNEEKKCCTMSSKNYIKSVCDQIEKLLEINLKNYGSPLDAGDFPEMNCTYILPPDNIYVYQMLIGFLQWAVTLGSYDVQYATNTLAIFGPKLQDGHIKRALQVYGFLKHHMQAKLFLYPTPMSHEVINFKENDWTKCYPYAEEYIYEKTPETKVEYLSITVFKDASHAMCLDTRQIITGFLIFLGSAPIFYYSKRQNTVEISIYGSEIFAMRILIEHLLVIHYKIQMVCMEVENVLLNWGIKMQ